MSDDDQVAAKLIKRIRSQRNISQAELARRAGLTRSVMNAYERGHRQPGVDALARIAAAAGMELQIGPGSGRIDAVRNDRILQQVLDLAEALPQKRRGELTYPSLRHLAA
jgi:transcriptional regulator with XRE-family HTH domain